MASKPQPKKAQPISAKQLHDLAQELNQMAATIDNCRQIAEQQPDKVLATYSWTSAKTGITSLAAFVKALDSSRLAALLGKPIEPGQLKPRSTALKPNARKVAESSEHYNTE